MITIWNIKTGEPRICEPVDAREILLRSSEWTTVDPNPPAAPQPQPEKRDAEIYRREPVGENPPEAPIVRDGPVIKNPTGASRGVPAPPNQFVRSKRDADATTKRPRRFPGE